MIGLVIASYNRENLLKDCIKSVLKSNNVPDIILVVDANSDFDLNKFIQTANFQIPINLLLSESDALKKGELNFLKLSLNGGGALSFKIGIQLLIEMKVKWIWMMDDDVEVEKKTLSNLIDLSEDYLFIQPQKFYLDGTPHEWSGRFNPNLGRVRYDQNRGMSEENGEIFVNYANFEGAFFHKTVVDKIGYPDDRFFIQGDDLIYGWLASQHCKIIYTNKARIIRKCNPAKDRTISSFSYYFFIRNQWLIHEYLKKHHLSYRSYKGKGYLFYLLIKEFFKSLEFSIIQKNINYTRVYFKGIRDGINKEFYQMNP